LLTLAGKAHELHTSHFHKGNRIVFDHLRKLDCKEAGDVVVTFSLQYQLPYSVTREGLHIYKDGNLSYIYSQLIFHCWAVFPCFDQPDIKAVLTMRVFAPEDWAVATNGKEVACHSSTEGLAKFEKDEDINWMFDIFDGPFAFREFEPTPPLPTYLYTVNAGPYRVYDHKSLYEDSPPQRVLLRQNCGRIDPLWISLLAEKTIKFYEEKFDFKYPFSKLDHVVCPDVRYAAMESAGCITYQEGTLSSK